MYDCCHEYPLIVELQFKGEVSEYYRLNCKGGGSVGSNGDKCKCKTWVKMVDPCCKKNGQGAAGNSCNTDTSCPDNQGGTSCTDQSGQNCPKDATTTDICELDQEFARNAKRIEQQILKLSINDQLDKVEFMALTAELIARIEHRAYKIRKGLKLEYNSDKTNLIMETDKNCHEESVLVYVLRGGAMGGAVGVAGGGTFYHLFTLHAIPLSSISFSKIPSITPINS